MNPLVQNFEYVPFDQIRDDHYLPAIKEAVDESREKIEKIKKDEASFKNTVVELDRAGLKVGRISEIFSNMLAAETNDKLQQISKEFMPLITNYTNDIFQDAKLFSQIELVYNAKIDLGSEDQMLLDKTYKSFIRRGARLDNDKKSRVRQIDEQLATISLDFAENVLKVTNEYYLHVDDILKLKGLPAHSLEAAAKKSQEKGCPDGWVFTLDVPSLFPFLAYCQDRELRKELYLALVSRCALDDETSNKGNIKEIVTLRAERAQILGYETHAHYILSERMAKEPATVSDFLDELKNKSIGKARSETEDLKQFAKKLDGIDDFASWDSYYYFEKLKKEKFNIDDEILRPYFSLDGVENGAFEVAKKLYGISFEKVNNIPVYHEDVSTFNVIDGDGSLLGVLYADFFPREGKRNGAWMTDYRKQYIDESGKDIRPHVSIVCNFTPPSDETPSLLTFKEALTLFHEFGHALHGLLSKSSYSSISGTNVYWDFVELPSQIMENWLYESECLSLLAKHWQTGELIRPDLVANIKKSSNFYEASQTLRQLGFGLLDMAWHTTEPAEIGQIEEFERNVLSSVTLLPLVDSANMSCSFGHIFTGGYSAGYYSYKWAEVLDADAFDLFKDKGIFNSEVAESFRANILSKGGTCHPMDLFKKFRGREPKNEALLRRSGISS